MFYTRRGDDGYTDLLGGPRVERRAFWRAAPPCPSAQTLYTTAIAR